MLCRWKTFPEGARRLLAVLLLMSLLCAVWLTGCSADQPETQQQTVPAAELPTEVPTKDTAAPEPAPDPVPEHVVSTATISATGDLLMHEPVVNTGWREDGSYDFDPIFQYLKEYTSAADYAAANLETTLYGPGRAYAGFPYFNCPDSLVESAKEAGFDMLLTGNNHSFDTGIEGYLRTIEVVRGAGLQTLGTMTSPEDDKWTIQEINGIRVGMMNFTYETSKGNGEFPYLNGLPMYYASYEYINCFRMNEPASILDEVEIYLKEMKDAGAEATMIFLHWGIEYQLEQNEQQIAIAQGLCDLGVDVIIGGHPHVVQPVDLLTSTTDPEHQTVCLYSMGNAVSNQRRGNLPRISTAHTEDGVLFSVTFEKYSDGTVYLAQVELMPTWVNLHYLDGRVEYTILPLDYDRVGQWGEMFGIQENTILAAQNSYDRTMAIVGAGLELCQDHLAEEKTAREAYYYDLAWNPQPAT